jgi:acyl-CoA reductase-like NAD-dependent aldehyde dehydrogenase
LSHHTRAQAKEKGGKVLAGGSRDGSVFGAFSAKAFGACVCFVQQLLTCHAGALDPTILEDVPDSAKLACEEAFGCALLPSQARSIASI